ncbi:MAG: hypothetical protein CMJ46_14960 [Planctomyces sp.]|nr:hypothetical protein [Planctomyces sp.]
MKFTLLAAFSTFSLFFTVCASTAAELSPAWTGAGKYRLLLEVPVADDLEGQEMDERVVAAEIDFAGWLRKQGLTGAVDLSTLQLHKINPETGEAVPGLSFAGAASPLDHPCRFDSEEFSGDFTSRVGRPSATEDGRPREFHRPRKVRLFNREQSPAKGKLIWAHVARAGESGAYALYFDLVKDPSAYSVSPAPWIGDADLLRRKAGASLGGFAHFTATVADLNGDGLEDLIAGTEKGDVMWFPNHGTVDQPVYNGCRILTDEAGPIDCGWYAAPFLYDWNNDGLLDMLTGSSGNVILWWKNVGTKTAHRFAFQGFVEADGGRLEVPEAPVSEDYANIFAHDYYNQPWVGDLNGDGLSEIVAGGYTTGRIFRYDATGRNEDGTPKLTYAGELRTADGPIDTIWAAAPFLWDANGDGRHDLLTGTWYWSGIEDPPEDGMDDYLRFYSQQADGTFQREPFPMTGEFPRGVIARPSLLYVNGDNTPDLLVSDNAGEVYFVRNIGEPGKPNWEMPGTRLTIPWGFETEWDAARFAGANSEEAIVGTYLWRREGTARSPEKKLIGAPQANGERINHPGPGYGDAYQFTILHDWNGDGHSDFLWGTQQGNIYVHLHTGGDDPLAFEAGELVKLNDGFPLKVGPEVVNSVEEATDFTILQGSRIVFNPADFDNDGVDDLLVGETYAQLWFFKGELRENNERVFAPGHLLATLATRPNQITCTDWNGDGLPDLILGGTANDPVVVYPNETGKEGPALGAGEGVAGLPYFFWGPRVVASDWNDDGDIDLLIQSEFFSFWVERSFLDHGYYSAKVVSHQNQYLEERPEQ